MPSLPLERFNKDSIVRRYGVALALAIGAGLLRYLLDPFLQETTTFLFFIIPVVLGAGYGGLGPGLLTALLSWLICDYFFIVPRRSLFVYNTQDSVRLVVFLVFSVIVSYLAERRRRAEAERERLLAEAEAARAEAVAATRARDEFLAIVSHELRTPLNAILGWTRLLRNGRLDAAQTARAIEVIERSALAQSCLVEDLLDVSRIVAGKLHIKFAPVELSAVASAALEAIRPAAEAGSLALHFLAAEGEFQVLGDAARLQQVFANLLGNAVKFTPPGGSVELRVERDGPRARITVTDTGRGIAPEFLPHVFKQFRQGDGSTSRTQGGLGLGLTIVRYIVEAHGGTVEAASAGPDRGATFTVTLPLADAGHAEQGEERRSSAT